jgi:putative membrane protein
MSAEPVPRSPDEPQLEGRDPDQESFLLSSKRTRLSFQRTRMSADRTLMSVIRTALSLIGFGFTIFQFFRYLRSSAGATDVVRNEAPRNFGLALVLLGVAFLALGITGHVRFMIDLRGEHDRLAREQLIPEDRFPYSTTLGAAILLGLIGLLAIVSMSIRSGPFG